MSKISELSDGGALQSTDYLIAVRSGGNVKVQPGSMTVDINGGTIDGVTIGGSSAGAVTGTTGQFNTSLNVDGTVTADGLTNSGSSTLSGNIFFNSTSGAFRFGTDAGAEKMTLRLDGDDLKLENGIGVEQVRFKYGGNVGIGTSSPENALHVAAADATLRLTTTSDSGQAGIELWDNQSGTSQAAAIRYEDSGNLFTIQGNANGTIFMTPSNTFPSASEAARIDSSGNLLVGKTASGYSANGFEVTSTGLLYLPAGSASAPSLTFSGDTNTGIGFGGADILYFTNGGSESARLDASGNLLVGGTNTNPAGAGVDGIALSSDGRLNAQVSGQTHRIGRGEDGDIIEFRVAGTPVGSINSYAGTRLGIGSNGVAGIVFATNEILPATSGSSLADNTHDVGSASYRWDDIYATNGTIQTSDRNEKQDIAELDEAERRAAVAAKGLLRKFRWINSVEEKGDDARIHFGIIAQDLQAAFEAEGLDAGRYAMFIHSAWTDEETGEERSRMGVRYSELLAFIIAAL